MSQIPNMAARRFFHGSVERYQESSCRAGCFLLFLPIFPSPHPASPTRLAPSCALPTSSSPTFEPSILQPRNLFRINTCKSVSKQTTLTLFRMNTYEKQGGGRASVFLTRNSALNLESLLARSHP